ncbi:hypothetical protein QFZ32_008791 [Streptomyces canus]|nr:hypothetical protein [Streptomyces canus]
MKPLVDGFSTKRTVSTRGFVCLSTRPASTCPVLPCFLTAPLREHRRVVGTRWRRLSEGRQALPTLVHLRNGQPYAQLTAGFGDRHHHRPPLRHRGRRAPGRPHPQARRSHAGRIDEGVSDPGRDAPADRPERRRPSLLLRYTQEARHARAGRSRPEGGLLWASPALAGAVHDVRAAREHGIIDALAEADITCWTDKGYQGASGTVRLPYRGRWDRSPSVSRPPTDPRKGPGPGRTGHRPLKSWRILRRLRCSTTRITSLVQAVLILRLSSSTRGWKGSVRVGRRGTGRGSRAWTFSPSAGLPRPGPFAGRVALLGPGLSQGRAAVLGDSGP